MLTPEEKAAAKAATALGGGPAWGHRDPDGTDHW